MGTAIIVAVVSVAHRSVLILPAHTGPRRRGCHTTPRPGQGHKRVLSQTAFRRSVLEHDRQHRCYTGHNLSTPDVPPPPARCQAWATGTGRRLACQARTGPSRSLQTRLRKTQAAQAFPCPMPRCESAPPIASAHSEVHRGLVKTHQPRKLPLCHLHPLSFILLICTSMGQTPKPAASNQTGWTLSTVAPGPNDHHFSVPSSGLLEVSVASMPPSKGLWPFLGAPKL